MAGAREGGGGGGGEGRTSGLFVKSFLPAFIFLNITKSALVAEIMIGYANIQSIFKSRL